MPDDGRGQTMMIRGRDLLNGVPKETEISQAQVAEALAEPVQQICEAVMTALEATPPDLAADIVDRGVMLTGRRRAPGELDLALREQTGLAISVADESLNCVALGHRQGAGIREAAPPRHRLRQLMARAAHGTLAAPAGVAPPEDGEARDPMARERTSDERGPAAPPPAGGAAGAGLPRAVPRLAHRLLPRVSGSAPRWWTPRPRLDWMMAPVTGGRGLAQDVRSYSESASRTWSSSASSSA
jgi:hypothetical protein